MVPPMDEPNDNEREDVAADAKHDDAALKSALRPDRPVVRAGELDAIRRITSGLNLSVIEQFQRAVAGPLALSQVFQTSRWLESVLPKPLELPAMQIMADASQTLLGSTSLSGLLAAQEATKRVREAFAIAYTPNFSDAFASVTAEAFRSQLFEVTRAADTFSTIMATIATAGRPLLVERAVAAGSRGWDQATRVLLPSGDDANLDVLTGLGRGVAGIGASGLLLGEDESEVEVDVVEWGPAPMHSMLRDLLADLDPALPAKLDGAWERVTRPGPDAASQAANSMMELVDWTLRLAAPNDDVLTWVHQEGKADELHDGKPTRVLRLKYLVRFRPGEADVARLYQRALSDLAKAAQSVKHSVGGKELEAVTSLVPTVEGLLFFALRP